MDPDQARHFVGPDLGSFCLQRCELTILGDYELKLIENVMKVLKRLAEYSDHAESLVDEMHFVVALLTRYIHSKQKYMAANPPLSIVFVRLKSSKRNYPGACTVTYCPTMVICSRRHFQMHILLGALRAKYA